MGVNQTVGKVDKTFARQSVRRSIPDEEDYAVTTDVLSEEVVQVGDWYRVDPVEYFIGFALVRPNRPSHSVIEALSKFIIHSIIYHLVPQ